MGRTVVLTFITEKLTNTPSSAPCVAVYNERAFIWKYHGHNAWIHITESGRLRPRREYLFTMCEMQLNVSQKHKYRKCGCRFVVGHKRVELFRGRYLVGGSGRWRKGKRGHAAFGGEWESLCVALLSGACLLHWRLTAGRRSRLAAVTDTRLLSVWLRGSWPVRGTRGADHVILTKWKLKPTVT